MMTPAAAESVGPEDREIIRRIFAPFATDIESIAVFGSRATGRAKPHSDIDMVVYGAVSDLTVDRLWTLFEDSSLSVSVDIIAYRDDLYPPLKRHIDRTAKQLFRREELQSQEGGSPVGKSLASL